MEDAVVSQYTTHHLKPELYDGGAAPSTPEATGIDGSPLGADKRKDQFHGISVDAFNAERVTLWRALLIAAPVDRSRLWPAQILRENMLLEDEHGTFFYVVRRCKWFVSLWRLHGSKERVEYFQCLQIYTPAAPGLPGILTLPGQNRTRDKAWR